MTPMQEVAYKTPSARSVDNLDDRFRHFVRWKTETFSVILSVNK